MGRAEGGRRTNEARRAEVARLRAEGLTLAEIGRRLGVSPVSVFAMLKRLGQAGRLPVTCRDCGAVALACPPPGATRPVVALCLPCLARHPEAPFGERLRSHRLAAGLTQSRLAVEVGVTKTAITHYEVGRTMPNTGTLARLVAVLGRGLLPPGAK